MDNFELKVTAPPVVGALTANDIEYVVNRIGHSRFLSSSSSQLTVLRSKLFEACKTMAYISQILYDFFEIEALDLRIDEAGRLSIGQVTVGSFITRANLFRFDKGSRIDIIFSTSPDSDDPIEHYHVKVWCGDRPLAEHIYPVKNRIYSYDMSFPAPSEFVNILTKDLTKV